jgi:PAS domain S-box-containing protein
MGTERPSVPLLRHLFRQVLWIVGLPLVLLGAAGGGGIWWYLHDGTERDMAALAQAQAGVAESTLEARREAVRVAAALLRGGAHGHTSEALVLEQLVTGGGPFDAAYLSDAQGRIAQARLTPAIGQRAEDLIGLDLRGHDWFGRAQAAAGIVWSSAFVSVATRRSTAVLATPIGGRRLLVAEISLPVLAQAIAAKESSADQVVALLDRRGRVVGHGEAERAAQQYDFSYVPLVARAMHTGPVRGAMEWNSRDWIASIEPVGDTGWLALAARDRRELLRPLAQLGALFVAAAALALALTVAGARLLAGAESSRHRALIDAARERSGPAGARSRPAFGIVEFDELWSELRALLDQLRDSEAKALASSRRLHEIFDATTEVAIVATDLQGRVTMFNRGAEKLLRRDGGEMVGRTRLLDWHEPRDLERRARELQPLVGELLSGFDVLTAQPRRLGFEVRETLWCRGDGQSVAVAEAITLTRDENEVPNGFLAVATDLSERQRAERAAAADRAKSEMLARVSHELRTPLNAVLGFAQLLAGESMGPLNAGQRRRVDSILAAGWHLLGIIDDLLDLSRIEAGELRLQRTPVAVAPLLEQALSLVEDMAEGRQVKLSVEPCREDLVACADAERLRQVLINLLSNAIKYNRPGGRVWLRTREQSLQSLRIEVEDNGLGMTDEQQAHLFEPFNRLGRERSGVQGTGIGLLIVRQVMQAMGGQLTVRSQAGAGSCFAISLPLVEPAPGEVVTRPAPLLADGEPHDVVLIEDNEVNALIIQAMLAERPGCRVHVCTTGLQGLARAREPGTALVLLDMNLPDIDGIECLRRLRGDARLAEIPVLMLSADTRDGMVAQARAQGAADYLFKPIEARALLDAVDRALRLRAHGDSATKHIGL